SEILHAADHVAGGADAGADKGRKAPPGAEIDIGVGQEHRRRDVALHDVETVAAAGSEFGEAAGRFEARPGAIFAGHIEPQPVVPGVADAHAEDGTVLDVFLHDRPTRWPDEYRVGLAVIE